MLNSEVRPQNWGRLQKLPKERQPHTRHERIAVRGPSGEPDQVVAVVAQSPAPVPKSSAGSLAFDPAPSPPPSERRHRESPPDRRTRPSDELVTDQQRNDLIVKDMQQVLSDGRSPLVLTSRKEHLDYLAGRLHGICQHIFVLKGGRGKAKEASHRVSLTRLPK